MLNKVRKNEVSRTPESTFYFSAYFSALSQWNSNLNRYSTWNSNLSLVFNLEFQFQWGYIWESECNPCSIDLSRIVIQECSSIGHVQMKD